MRDIQEVLSRYGVWASDNSNIDFASIAAGFKGLLPPAGRAKDSCSDDDGLIVDGAVTRLRDLRTEEFEMIVRHYILKQSKSAIARSKKCDEKLIRIKLQVAEGFIDGCISMLGVRLDMDKFF